MGRRAGRAWSCRNKLYLSNNQPVSNHWAREPVVTGECWWVSLRSLTPAIWHRSYQSYFHITCIYFSTLFSVKVVHHWAKEGGAETHLSTESVSWNFQPLGVVCLHLFSSAKACPPQTWPEAVWRTSWCLGPLYLLETGNHSVHIQNWSDLNCWFVCANTLQTKPCLGNGIKQGSYFETSLLSEQKC